MWNKWDIWRNYDKKDIDISWALNDIHTFLFSQNNISNKTSGDAELLTKFFREVKRLSMAPNNSEEDEIKTELINEEVGNKIAALGIDFSKHGPTKGRSQFEEEITKLIDEVLINGKDGNAISRNNSNPYWIKITDGKADNDLANIIIEDTKAEIENSIQEIQKYLEQKKIKNENNKSMPLKISQETKSKIDIKASSKAQIKIDILGSAGPELRRALNLLKDSSFILYSSASADPKVRLGSSDPEEAISAVTKYVYFKTQNKYASYAYNFYNHHNERKIMFENLGRNDDKGSLNDIYNHYNHMRSIYEITGMGLNFNFNDFFSADFILVNRTGISNDIKVYAVQDLINQLNIGNINRYRNAWTFDN